MESIGDISLKLKTNLSKKGSIKLKASKQRDARVVNRKAEYIASKFNDWDHLPFYRKAVWRLPERQLDDILERSPSLWYFIKVCKLEMGN